MKNLFLVLLILIILIAPLNLKNVYSRSDSLIIQSPLSGDTISTYQSIVIKNSYSDKYSLSICIVDSYGQMIKEKLFKSNNLYYYNWDTSKYENGNYYIFAVIENNSGFLLDSEVISIIVDNSISSIKGEINPSLCRSGMNLSISLLSSVSLNEAYILFEDKLRINLNYITEKGLWKGDYIVPPTINEGSHLIKFFGQDLKGNSIITTSNYMVCNSEPIISFPPDSIQINQKKIQVKGLYKSGSKVYLYNNNVPISNTIVDDNGFWFIDNIILNEGKNTLSVFSKEVKDLITTYPTQSTSIECIENGIIVLTYHSITDNDNGMYSRSISKFRSDMEYIALKGYTPVNSSRLISFFENSATLPEKPIIITIDDGLQSIYKNAYPILKEFDFSALFFVIVSRIGLSKEYSSWSELLEMQSSRLISVESHTYNSHFFVSENEGSHSALTSRIPLPNGLLESYSEYRSRVYDDLKKSKEILEEKLNKKVQFLSVPFGNANKEVQEISKEIGLKGIFSSNKGVNKLPGEKWKIKRFTINRDDKIEDILF